MKLVQRFTSLFLIIFCLIVNPAIAQESIVVEKIRPVLGLPYQEVGLIRQVISQSVDSPTSEEIYLLEDENGKMIPLSSKLDFSLYLNKSVALEGNLDSNSSTVEVTRIYPLEKIRKRPIMQPENIPKGQTNYDLSTKEGQAAFEQLTVGGGTNIPQQTVETRQTIVVPVTFINNTNLLFTQEQLVARMFTDNMSVNAFFREASFRMFGISGVVTDPIAIPYTDTGCTENMFGVWKQAVMDRIPANLKDSSNNFIFMPPVIEGCAWQAVSTVGNKGVNSTKQYAWVMQHPLRYEDRLLFIKSVAHEYGHQLGCQHSDGITLAGVNVGAADLACFMAGDLHYPNSFTRLSLGWYTPATKITVLNGRGNYSVTLRSITQIIDKKASKIILIPRYNASEQSTGDMVIIEIRSDVGPLHPFESFSGGMVNYKNGVTLRIAPLDIASSGRSRLINTSPTNQNNFVDAPLVSGRQYVDSVSGINIGMNVFSIAGGAKVSVEITYGP